MADPDGNVEFTGDGVDEILPHGESTEYDPDIGEVVYSSVEKKADDTTMYNDPLKDPEEEMKSTVMTTTTTSSSRHAVHTTIPNGFFARRAKAMARTPWWHFLAALSISIALSVVGIVVGDFKIAVNNAGWRSRGTLIAKRATQVTLVQEYNSKLAYGTVEDWEELENTVQKGWESGANARNRRDLEEDDGTTTSTSTTTTTNTFTKQTIGFNLPNYGAASSSEPHDDESTSNNKNHNHGVAPFPFTDDFARRLADAPGLDGCPVYHYTSGNALSPNNLWPTWKARKSDISALDSQVIHDICVAELNTNRVLAEEQACFPCTTGQCLPPISLVLFARMTVGDTSFLLNCDELAESWKAVQANATSVLQECIPVVEDNYVDELTVQDQCAQGFGTFMVDSDFGPDESIVMYTSSVFFTSGYSKKKDLYDMVNKFDRASSSSVIEGAYDTGKGDFNDLYTDSSVSSDMILAMGSAAITATAILVHTRSPWITMVGLIQIILSFPLAFFVYTFIAGLEFFPFLNFIGVFVVFALGADDVFVAIDKWKNARIANRRGSVEDVAAVALPDAASAMFLTTVTTAVAFFATAICPVAPLKCFAVFCGLLIVFDYFMCILLVFPALCIYDRWLGRKNNFCCSLHVCKKKDGEEFNDVLGEDETKPSLIRRLLTGFYNGFHFIRWPLMAVCIGATVTAGIFAARLEMPQSSDVRLLSESLEYEKNYIWRNELFYTALDKSGGNPGVVMWGVKPADTGSHANPDTWTSLVLDDDFDLSSTESQEYMLGFCDRFFAQDFAAYTQFDTNGCAINRFDSWLQDSVGSTGGVYEQYCNGATGLPMNPDNFNECISAWTSVSGSNTILDKDGVVRILYINFQQRVRFDSPYDDLSKEWNVIEDYMKTERAMAPDGVNKGYHSSGDFWWYDTNGQMLRAAFGAAGIALGFSGVVVLLSSRSVVLTLFSIFTIGYVLAATTATLVASGWTLGFLESVCFAILIGISCDFVIHFGHAYSSLKGDVCRHERTKHALISMGPSILAAAFTTICAAIIMLFTVISFFQQFAQILFYTIIHATIGSFVVFLTLTDCIGPSNPTYLVDKCTSYCFPNTANDNNEYKEGAVEVEKKSTSSSSLEATEKQPKETMSFGSGDEMEA